MAKFRASKWALLILVSSLLAQSCASTKDRRSPQKADQSPSESSTSAKKRIAEGDYQRAIDHYDVEYRSRRRDPAFVKDYAKSVEDMKKAADEASEKGEFASAGRVYTVLLKNYSRLNGVSEMLSFDEVELNRKLSQCKKSLSAQGFQEYRKGNLAGAIDLWESLLAIDPDNADIKGAVRTAKLQKKNMEERASGR